MNKRSPSRRTFVKKLAGGAVLASGVPSILLNNTRQQELAWTQKSISANERVRIGAIGMGIMGFNNCQTALRVPGVELVAACDLYEGRRTRVQEVFGPEVAVTEDYREILERADIDAVIISTTDHWHDTMAIEAMNKGKAVYCEKPMVHHIEEGQAVIKAQQKTGAVFQVGSQRVSSILYLKAKELFESGVLGQLVVAEIRYDRQSALGAWQYSIPLDASPQTVAWDRYLGDAPKRAFDKERFFRWRNYQDYGTGVAGDLFVHLFSGLHLITQSKGPERIFATGGLRYWKDGRDVPDVMLGSYDYPATEHHPAFNVQMRVNFIDGQGGGSSVKLIGTEGVLDIGWSSLTLTRSKLGKAPGYGGWDSYGTFSESMQEAYQAWYEQTYPQAMQMQEPEQLAYRVPEGYSDHFDHHLNFFDAIRNGTPVVEDVVFGLRAAGAALACNQSYFENRIIKWDAERMRVV